MKRWLEWVRDSSLEGPRPIWQGDLASRSMQTSPSSVKSVPADRKPCWVMFRLCPAHGCFLFPRSPRILPPNHGTPPAAGFCYRCLFSALLAVESRRGGRRGAQPERAAAESYRMHRACLSIYFRYEVAAWRDSSIWTAAGRREETGCEGTCRLEKSISQLGRDLPG